MTDAIRVLVVDDSIVMRYFITKTLAEVNDVEVVGTAGDGEEAVTQARLLRPDVITMDVLMPRVDGLDALATIMRERPTPVVMVSSVTADGSDATVRALELGAVDFITKPAPGTGFMERKRLADDLIRKVRRAALAHPRALTPQTVRLLPKGEKRERTGLADLAIVIGCSTGGPQALTQLIPALPADLPAAVVVVQHMPAGFTRTLAQRLDTLSSVIVREATDGDPLRPGQVLIAPGAYHLQLTQERQVRLDERPSRHGVRPSVDVTLESAAGVYGPGLLAMILTGMGLDGAEGAAAVKERGGMVVAEHASTCVVYGMPRAVAERGISDYVTPLHQCSEVIGEWIRARMATRSTMVTSS